MTGFGSVGFVTPTRRAVASQSAPPPRLAIAYALAIPLVVVPLPFGQSIGAIDMLLPFALVALLRRRWTVNRAIAGWFIFFATTAAITTIAIAIIDPVRGTSGQTWLIVRMFAIFAPMLLVLSAERITPSQLKIILKCVLFSTAATCVIGIVMHELDIEVRPGQQRIWDATGSSLRAGGLLGNSGDMGHIAAALGAAACSLGAVYLGRKWVSLACVALALYVTYISSSRAAMLSVFVTLVIMSAVYFRGRRILIVLFGLPIALAATYLSLIPLFATTTDPTLRRFDIFNLSGQSEFFAAASRFGSWDRLLVDFRENPFLGIGYGNGGAGDNSFLSILTETGLVPGFAYMGVWLALLFTALRLPRGNGRVATVALVLGEVAFMFTVDTHRMWPSTGAFLLVIAVAIRLAQVRQEDPVRSTSLPTTSAQSVSPQGGR